MAKRLTDIAIRNLKPGARRREIPDPGQRGLYVQLQPSGTRGFAVRYRLHGRPCKLTLARGVTLAQARKLAADALYDVARGVDPAEHRKAQREKAERANASTLAAVAQTYMRREGAKLRTADQCEGILRRLILPALGAQPIASIRRSDIVQLLDKIEDTSGPRMADVTLALLRRIMNWHATRADDYVPPIVKGMRRYNPAEHRRSRILNDGELRAVWAATADPLNPFAAMMRLLLLTGARRGEIAGLRDGEIADGIWVLPASRSKSKAEVVRPLSRAALAVIEGLPRIAGSPYLFSNNGGRSPPRVFSGEKAALDHASGVTGWRLHDARRTSRSLLSRAGINVDIAERCLGHSLPTIRATYDQHKYLAEMGHAFEALASLIERIVRLPAAKVTDIAAELGKRRRG